jgi:hypothetical protein
MHRIYSFYLKYFEDAKVKIEELGRFLKIDSERRIEGFPVIYKLERGFAKSWTKVMRLFLSNIKLLLLYQTKKEEIDVISFLV